jgi:PAS domain S-box-containing protein
VKEKFCAKRQPLKELERLRQENAKLKKSESRLIRAEEKLRESEKMYRALLETSFDSLAIHKTDAEILDISGRSIKMLGFENANELIGASGFIAIAPEDREKARQIHQKILDEGYVRSLELTFQKKDGARFYAEINATLIKDSKGNPKGIIGATRDITERKKAEKALWESEKKLKQEVKTLRRQIQESKKYPEIIGNSEGIHKVIELIHQVALTNSTVLIYGETGSGKDLAAKAIHFNSSRKESPFVILNCAALPEQLIESELFGYARGAFTGANQDKKGLFEESDKGTIFLNEIGEIPLKLQAKLLEVLESQCIRRLGDNKSINVDVRVIAATNKDLNEEIKKHQFREDLFYRLNVLPIKLPPLRERKEDIPLLVKHFLVKYCSLLNKEITEISPEAMEILYRYSYPGNVRELENIIQRSIVFANSSILEPQHFPHEIRNMESTDSLKSLANMEKHTIEAAIRDNKGDLVATAKQLGIGRATLYRKIKRYGIYI